MSAQDRLAAEGEAKRRVGPARHATPAGRHAGLRVVFSEREIRRRVIGLANRLNRDYRDSTLHFMVLLENTFPFAADLMRRLHISLVCHFLHAAVKDRTWHHLPLREITYTPEARLAGENVLVVDGIIQTGVTLDFLLRSIQDQSPKSLRAAALIEKAGEHKVAVKPDYVGFRTRRGLLVGYGLGFEGRYVNLPYIAELERGRN